MKQKCKDNRLPIWSEAAFSALASVIIVLSHKFVTDGTLFSIDAGKDTFSTFISYIYQMAFLVSCCFSPAAFLSIFFSSML